MYETLNPGIESLTLKFELVKYPHWGLRNASKNEYMHNIILKITKKIVK